MTKLNNLWILQPKRITNLLKNCEIQSIGSISKSFSTSSNEMLKDKENNSTVPEENYNQTAKTFIIEGNIGCGKSTMLEIFGKRDDIEAVPEQVERWTNWNGVNMLQAMYDDPIKYGVEFQNIVIKTMVENHLKKTNRKIKLMERSLFSTERCFIKNSYNDKVFTKNQYVSLSEKCQQLREDLKISVDCFIYMRISPEIASLRIKERGRTGEENISLDLLQKLHHLHEEYIATLNLPVVIVDANKSLNEVISQFSDILEKH